MAHLSVSLMRSFQVQLDGQPVTGFKSDKVRALLAFLAVEADRSHRRDVLAGLLWPDMPDGPARNNLRDVLANLRTAIGDRDAAPPYLAITRETLQFNTASDHWLDVAVFDRMREDAQALKHHAEGLTRLSEGMGFSSFLGTGNCYWGEALAKLGHVREGTALIREGLAVRRSIGARCYSSGILGALASAQTEGGRPAEGLTTLAEAFAFVEETDERYCEPELYRLRAKLLLSQGDNAGAEASLQTAVKVARRQKAKPWELRAATSLARLWQRQGRADEARQVLGEIYGWFTEGFDTPDLKEAKALLEQLAQKPRAG